MKNKFKLFGIVVLVAAIGLSMVACGEEMSGGVPDISLGGREVTFFGSQLMIRGGVLERDTRNDDVVPEPDAVFAHAPDELFRVRHWTGGNVVQGDGRIIHGELYFTIGAIPFDEGTPVASFFAGNFNIEIEGYMLSDTSPAAWVALLDLEVMEYGERNAYDVWESFDNIRPDGTWDGPFYDLERFVIQRTEHGPPAPDGVTGAYGFRADTVHYIFSSHNIRVRGSGAPPVLGGAAVQWEISLRAGWNAIATEYFVGHISPPSAADRFPDRDRTRPGPQAPGGEGVYGGLINDAVARYVVSRNPTRATWNLFR
jgi:hypothetical protein